MGIRLSAQLTERMATRMGLYHLSGERKGCGKTFQGVQQSVRGLLRKAFHVTLIWKAPKKWKVGRELNSSWAVTWKKQDWKNAGMKEMSIGSIWSIYFKNRGNKQPSQAQSPGPKGCLRGFHDSLSTSLDFITFYHISTVLILLVHSEEQHNTKQKRTPSSHQMHSVANSAQPGENNPVIYTMQQPIWKLILIFTPTEKLPLPQVTECLFHSLSSYTIRSHIHTQPNSPPLWDNSNRVSVLFLLCYRMFSLLLEIKTQRTFTLKGYICFSVLHETRVINTLSNTLRSNWCPCPWQGVGKRWPQMSLPAQPTPWLRYLQQAKALQ